MLSKWTDTIKKLSGWGLFVFALIFIIKGFKLRAAAQSETEAKAKREARARPDEPVDESLDIPEAPAGTDVASTGFTVGTAEERAKGETTGLTGAPVTSSVHSRCAAAHPRPPPPPWRPSAALCA